MNHVLLLKSLIYYNNNFIRTFNTYNTILRNIKTTYTCSVYEDGKRQQSTKIQLR